MSSPAPGRRWRLAGAAALVVLVVVAYRATPQGSFHFDDVQNIVDVPALHAEDLNLQTVADAVRGARLPRRVVANLSFALDWWRGGGAPGPFLVTNVAIHGLAALAVYALLLSVIGRFAPGSAGRDPCLVALAAFIGAALWAVHPIQVQSVAYVVQRMASLATLFSVLSLLVFLWARVASSRARRAGLFVLCALFLVLGAASKENALVTVLLMALAEITFFRGGLGFFATRHGAVMGGAAVLVAVLAAADLWSGAGPMAAWVLPDYAHRDFSLGERLLTQPRVIAFHFSQILWPAPERFSLEHDFTVSTGLLAPASTAFALTGVVLWCAMGAVGLARARFRTAGFFILWVPAALSVESTVLALEMVFEHRLYLPSVGLAGLAALAAYAALERCAAGHRALQVAGAVAALAAIASLCAATAARMPTWRTMESLCEQSVAVAPRSYRAWGCLGLAHLRRARVDEARSALDRARALNPRSGEVLGLSAVVAMLDGDLALAERLLRRAIELPGAVPSTRNVLLRSNLGIVSARQGRHREAVAQFRAALSVGYLRPHDAARLWNLVGVSYRQLGSTSEAKRAFQSALDASPREWHAGYNLARLHLAAGEVEAARRALLEARSRARAVGESPDPVDRLLDHPRLAQ